jgi:hypothetical protein
MCGALNRTLGLATSIGGFCDPLADGFWPVAESVPQLTNPFCRCTTAFCHHTTQDDGEAYSDDEMGMYVGTATPPRAMGSRTGTPTRSQGGTPIGSRPTPQSKYSMHGSFGSFTPIPVNTDVRPMVYELTAREVEKDLKTFR